MRALLLAHHERLLSRDNEIEHLKLVISKLRRMVFGVKSERVTREIEQLELKLEELETVGAERIVAERVSSTGDAAKPSRRPLPEHLPREVRTHMPPWEACPDCGGELRKFGEDVSEMLEYVPSSFKVIRYVRPKLNCRSCEKIVEAAALPRPIDVRRARRTMCVASSCVASRFVPLTHAPGEAQADFGEALVVIAGVEQKVQYLRTPQRPTSSCCAWKRCSEASTGRRDKGGLA